MTTSYVKPQALIIQEFKRLPTPIQDAQYPFIFGVNCHLVRYDQAAEKANGWAGSFVRADASWIPIPWAGLPTDADATPDAANARVFIDNAEILNGASDDADSKLAPVRYYPNKVKLVDATPTEGFTSEVLTTPTRVGTLQADVKIGDKITLVAEDESFSSTIIGMERFRGTPTIGAPSFLTSPATTSKSIDAPEGGFVGGTQDPDHPILIGEVASETASAMNKKSPFPYGRTYEVYVIRCIQGGTPSNGGDGGATVPVFSVESASGTDDYPEVSLAKADNKWVTDGGSPETFRYTLPISSARAVSVVFEADVGTVPFVAGQTWRLTAVWETLDHTIATNLNDADFTGNFDTSYVVQVTSVELDATQPDTTFRASFRVTTASGIDGGIIPNEAMVVGNKTTLAVGRYGVTLDITPGSVLVVGDAWRIDVAAGTEGGYTILSLKHSLPTTAAWVETNWANPSKAYTWTIYRVANIEVPKSSSGFRLTAENNIELNGGLRTTINDPGNVVPNCEVHGGDIYVSYRAFLQTWASSINSIDDVSEVATKLGTIDPENPLAMAVYMALTNSGGKEVYFMASADDTRTAHAACLSKATMHFDLYNIVPATQNLDVLNDTLAHCKAMSDPAKHKWRVCWVSRPDPTHAKISYQTSSGGTLEATITSDGTNNVVVTASGGQFIEDNVVFGDQLRIGFISNEDGTESYSTYTIKRRVSATQLELVTGPASPISIASRAEIWRPLSGSTLAKEIGAQAAHFGDMRAMYVWPATITVGNQIIPGQFLAAALAGLRSATPPQQALTRIQVTGIDRVSIPLSMNDNDLDILASHGVWIVEEDEITRMHYTRHALTTDMTDLNSRENSKVTNRDSICKFLWHIVDIRIGKSNISSATIEQLRVDLEAAIDYLVNKTFVHSVGSGQILSGTITELAQDTVFRDKVVVRMEAEVPNPLNNLDLHFVS